MIVAHIFVSAVPVSGIESFERRYEIIDGNDI